MWYEEGSQGGSRMAEAHTGLYWETCIGPGQRAGF